MKHLLIAINAKYIHSSLSVRTIGYYLKKLGTEADFLEYTINQPVSDIVRELYLAQSGSYMFSSYIWNIDYIKKIIVLLNQILPQSKIFLGGPEASYKAKELIDEFPFISGILVGEGEETAHELINAINTDGSLSSIKGLQLASGYTGVREFIDMDSLSFNYPDIESLNNQIIYYESTRGCPFSCSYCLSSVEQGVRARSLNLVYNDLLRFIKADIRQLKFVDRTFNYDDKRAIKIWDFLIKNDNGVTNFHFEISADLLSTKAVELLSTARKGLFQFEIGVQSVNPKTLKEIQRVTDLELIKNSVQQLSKPDNIHLHLDLIAGLPFEDFDSFVESFNWIFALRPQQFQLGFLKVLGGSLMAQHTDKYELIYDREPPFQILKNKWLSYSELCALEDVEHMVDHYYNSGRYSNMINYLIYKNFPSSFDFFYKLSVSYGKFKGKGPLSKLDYYELIAIFCKDNNITIDDSLTQLCMLDIMLHEKPKKYPSWVDSEEDYEKIMSFYNDDSLLKKYLPSYPHHNPKLLSRITHLNFFTINPVNLKRENIAILVDYNKRDILNKASFTKITELSC